MNLQGRENILRFFCFNNESKEMQKKKNHKQVETEFLNLTQWYEHTDPA